MKFWTLIGFVWICFSSAHAQMIEEMQLEDFKVAFNDKYIKDNNIKSVKANTSYKKPLQTIVEKGTYNRYIFNEKGQLISLTETFKISHQNKDSSITKYNYEGQKLEEKITYTSQGELAYTYTFDKNGNIEKLSYEKGGLYEAKSLVFEEFYTYEFPNDTTKIKWYLNRHGNPYQKEIFVSNQFGYLLSIEKILVFGGRASKIDYIYNEKGKLAERKEAKKDATYITKYIYDNTQNLIELNYFKNDQQLRHEEFLYNEKTGMIKALLSKDMSSGTITITKYEVTKR